MKGAYASPGLSLGREREVRGYTVRRLPLGAYLRAAQSLRELPDDVMKALFPELDAGAALKKLRYLTKEEAVGVIARGLSALPKPLLSAMSLLTGVSEHNLENDPAIGLDGMLELLTAVVEVNELENFTKAAREALARLRTAAGCKG